MKKTIERINKKPIFLKIDIEGWEYRLLKDLITYSEVIEGLVIEFHDENSLKWKSSFIYSNEPHLLPVYFGIETGKIIAPMQYLHIPQLPLYLQIIK